MTGMQVPLGILIAAALAGGLFCALTHVPARGGWLAAAVVVSVFVTGAASLLGVVTLLGVRW